MNKLRSKIIICFFGFLGLSTASTDYVYSGFSEGLGRVQIDGKWGFINRQGQLVIKPQFDQAGLFKNGGAYVVIDDEKIIINTNGVKILSHTGLGYPAIAAKGKLVPIWNSRGWGYANENGNIVIDTTFDWAGPFKGELARASHEGKMGFINKQGNYVIDAEYNFVHDYSEGTANVVVGTKHFFIDQEGLKLFNKEFGFAFPFSEGLAGVNTNQYEGEFLNVIRSGNYGFINHDGAWVIPPIFDQVRPFMNGLAMVQQHGRIGLINTNGTFVIQPEYSSIRGCGENMWKLDSGQKGIADQSGKIIPVSESYLIKHFSEGMAPVRSMRGGKFGYINKEGKLIIPLQFDDAWLFSEGRAPVKVDEKWGYIDQTGRYIWNPSK